MIAKRKRKKGEDRGGRETIWRRRKNKKRKKHDWRERHGEYTYKNFKRKKKRSTEPWWHNRKAPFVRGNRNHLFSTHSCISLSSKTWAFDRLSMLCLMWKIIYIYLRLKNLYQSEPNQIVKITKLNWIKMVKFGSKYLDAFRSIICKI